MNWAVIDSSNKVTSIVVSDTRPENGVKATDGSGAAVGYYWNGWTFDAPRWTSYQFLNRFTSAERTAIRNAAKSDDTIADFLLLASSAQEIIADDAATVAGMNYLVASSIITEARKLEILS